MTAPAPGLLCLVNGSGSGADCLFTIDVDQRVIGYCRNGPLMKRGQSETVVGSTNPMRLDWVTPYTQDVVIGGVGATWDDKRKELIILGWEQGTVHWFDANFAYKRSRLLLNSDDTPVGPDSVDVESVRMYGPDHIIVGAADWNPPPPDGTDRVPPSGNLWKIDLRTYSVVQHADILTPFRDWRSDGDRGVDHIALSPDLSIGYFTSEGDSIYTFDPVAFVRTDVLVDHALPSSTTYGIRTLPDGSIVVVGDDHLNAWCTQVAPDGSIIQQINMGHVSGGVFPFALEVDPVNYVAYASSLGGNVILHKMDLIAGTSKHWIAIDPQRRFQVADGNAGGLCWIPNDFGNSAAAPESGSVVFY